MGIRSRYAAAFLILCLVPGIVQGAVRQTLKPSAERIITESIQGVTLPNGAAAYYGHDRLYALDISVNARPGDVVGPTIRPVKPSTIGVPSFPYGGQPYYPDMSSPQLKVKPKAVVPKAPVINKFKGLLKANPAGLAFSAGTIAAAAAVGWAIDELTGQVTKQSDPETMPYNPEYAHWSGRNFSGLDFKDSSPALLCAKLQQNTGYRGGPGSTPSKATINPNGSSAQCTVYYRNFSPTDPEVSANIILGRVRSNCPSGSTYNPTLGSCSGLTVSVPVTAADIDSADFSAVPQDWFDGILRDTCKGSPSPTSCFEDLRSESPVEGPSVVQGSSSVSTQTKLNPDGSTTTTTTTTQREHPISYGNGYFDVGTRETKTTEVDGVPVSTEVTEDTRTPAPSDPNAEPDPEPSEQEYTFDDPDFPEIEPFYEVKYPDGLAGVWSDTFASLQDTAFVEFMQGFVPSFSGSCPSFGLSFQIAQWASFGSLEFSSICYVLDFVKILLLVTAMFTSRALIFGG